MNYLVTIIRGVYGLDYHIVTNVVKCTRPTPRQLAAAAAAELVLRCHMSKPWERLDPPHMAWVNRLLQTADFPSLALVCGMYPTACSWAADRVWEWLARQRRPVLLT